ncbi:ABC transporter substrate-binding protein [Spirochaeta cellobiosiphila]|uniref:ABC transporter substrate-binding protein n=1 Tax=Spirochaeta cellobiosiphila TaxID=504483 RepID=UPI000409DEF8|nr:ABC transporter substrate-binding protein [Spirochaeta cellobiosiphila]
MKSLASVLKTASLILITALTLMGCQKKQTPQTVSKSSDGPVEIEFWHAFSDAPRSDWIQERADEWNAQHKDYKVVPARKGSYRETLQAAVLAARQGDAPHIVQLFEVGSQLAKDSGIFEPVGNIGQFDTSDYIAPVLNYYTLDGTVNSIPFNSSSPILYYNKDMMKQAGLDPSNPPTTLEELTAACEKAQAAGIKNAKITFALHSWYVEEWLAEQGAPLVNNDNGRKGRATEVLLESKAVKKIFNWFKDTNDKGLYSYTGKLEDWNGSEAIFEEGKAMFFITSTADVGNVETNVSGKFEMGTGLYPIPSGTKRNGTVIGGASVWITKGHSDEELEASRDFVLFMTNTDNMISWHKLTGYYPVRTSSVNKLKEEGWFETEPLRTIAFKQLLETIPNSYTAGALMGSFMDTRTIVEEALQKVISGKSVEESLKEAKVLADTKLKEYNDSL